MRLTNAWAFVNQAGIHLHQGRPGVEFFLCVLRATQIPLTQSMV